MESGSRKNCLVIVSLSPTFELLRTKCLKNECSHFYEAIVNNIVDTVLDEDDSSRGLPAEGFEIACEMLQNHFDDAEIGLKLCNEVLNTTIQSICEHVQDIDHPNYKNLIDFHLSGEDLKLTVYEKERVSIFDR